MCHRNPLQPFWRKRAALIRRTAAAIVLISCADGRPGTSHAATVAATYEFNQTFAADQTADPALVSIDPEGSSTFQADTVFGQNRTVWSFNGVNSPASMQSGLTVNTTNLVGPESFSLEMVCKFTQGNGAWRRLVDVQNRQSDNGFYVNPSNNLALYPVSGSTSAWTTNVYHTIVLTNDGTNVTAYLDGLMQFSDASTLMNLDADPTDNPSRLMGFFLDNVAGGGQGEWSPGSVAFIQLWNGVLTPADVDNISADPFAVPEPSSGLLLAAGAAGLFGVARRLRPRA